MPCRCFAWNGGVIINIFSKLGIFSGIVGENKKTKLLFILDGVFINAAIVLTMGVFLSGYIVLLNGTDFLVGLLNNSNTWAAIVAIFSFMIYERMEKRKKFLITLLAVSRLMICSIVFLPLIFGNQSVNLYIVTIFVIVGNVLWGIYSIGFSVWLMSALPKHSRNEFIYVRMFWIRISFTIFTIVMGIVLDWFKKSYTGFMVVFIISLILSAIDVIILMKIEEPSNAVNKEVRFNKSMFFEPIRNNEYRGFLIFVFLFYASLSASSSFTPLYLIRYLKFDYSFISTVNVFAYIFMIICTKVWGRIELKKGLTFVFRITAFIVVAEFLIYSFLNNKTYYLLLFAPIFAGIGNSGFNIAVFNFRYEIMPENSKTIYEGWFGAVLGLSALAGPVMGNFLKKRLPVIENVIYQHSSFQMLYLISFVLATGVILLAFYSPGKFQLIRSGSRNVEGQKGVEA